MHNGVKAVALLKERVGQDKVVEGWIEGPIAEAADLRGINTLMLDFFDDPAFVRDLFEFVVEMELRFARAQVDAGIDLMGVGDAAASLIGPHLYEEFVWPYEKKLVDGLHAMGRGCGYISAATPGVSWAAWASSAARLSIWIFWRPSPKAVRKWGQARSCWATSTPSASSATAPRKASSRRLPSAMRRLAPVTLWSWLRNPPRYSRRERARLCRIRASADGSPEARVVPREHPRRLTSAATRFMGGSDANSGVRWGHELLRIPLTRPAGTLSPSGERDGVRGCGSWVAPTPVSARIEPMNRVELIADGKWQMANSALRTPHSSSETAARRSAGASPGDRVGQFFRAR